MSDKNFSAPGPSPWYLVPLDAPGGGTLTWRQAHGRNILVDRAGRDLLLVDSHCWVKRLGPSHLLVWHQTKRSAVESGDATAAVYVHLFDLQNMTALSDANAASEALERGPESVVWSGGHVAAFSASPYLPPGLHPVDLPAPLSQIPELLLLIDAARLPDPPRIHVWSLRPGLLDVIPQDWFNSGRYDFGYEWITRIARHPVSGRLVGDGIRIGPFALDESGTQVEKFLNHSPFESGK